MSLEYKATRCLFYEVEGVLTKLDKDGWRPIATTVTTATIGYSDGVRRPDLTENVHVHLILSREKP